ncbi:PREDICTED: strigolactone esterase D14-like [Nelumbo nucifera]|uniref:Strigolactone esterase D14-like n=2 Tax=Nelumbo nucifera TaxID=4432 RepID=A0A1U8A6T7_NELNU|nr:PREDICTED: strigolactone esterase D14-like [Nelumbo nucifera]DAD42116.1 TPA_asm: hypothetical protein HUJ06_000346 [Nelumbo nucifera]
MDLVNGHGRLVQALNARVYGNGTETLVLSHGFGSDQTVWHYILPCLAFYFKVVVFDLVFAGNVSPALYNPSKYSSYVSYAQDLQSLLDELKVTKSIYLGHSMSAMIGCIAATQRPDLFKQLILLGASPRYLNAEGYYGGFERSDVETVFQAIRQNFSGWVSNFAPKAIGVNDMAAIKEFERSLRRMKPDIALDVAKTVFLSDYREVLKQVRVPCIIIQAERDFVVPKSVAFYLETMIVGGYTKVEILETQGHFPHLTAFPLLLGVLKKVLQIDN